MNLEAAVAAAADVEGWMSLAELEWLGARAATRQTIVEVGSWRGRSTKLLAAMCPGVVWAVDDLSGVQEWPVRGQDSHFRRNLAAEIASGKLRILCQSSLEAATNFVGLADMVFIDAGHEYPIPLEHLEAWSRVLAPDGLLCGHDAQYPGVERSLREWGDTSVVVETIWEAYL